MIDHLSIGVRDVARARRFYDAALAPLGYKCMSAGEASLGYGDAAVALWISAAERPVQPDDKSGLHVLLLRRRRGRASTRSTPPRSRPAAGQQQARPAAGLRPPTTRLSWSIPTAIA